MTNHPPPDVDPELGATVIPLPRLNADATAIVDRFLDAVDASNEAEPLTRDELVDAARAFARQARTDPQLRSIGERLWSAVDHGRADQVKAQIAALRRFAS